MIQIFDGVIYHKEKFWGVKSKPTIARSITTFMEIMEKPKNSWTLDEEDDFDFAWVDMQVHLPAIKDHTPLEVYGHIKHKLLGG